MVGLLTAIVASAGCTFIPTFDHRLSKITEPYTFSTAKWELKTIPREAGEWLFPGGTPPDKEAGVVARYFAIAAQIRTLERQLGEISSGNGQGEAAPLEAELSRWQVERAGLETAVESILERQLGETLAEQGIFNPLTGARVRFPPLNFTIEPPPHLLVVSPRDRIESMREVTLKQDVSREEMEAIEAEVDRLGVSALVVRLGGFGGTYPTLVTDRGSLRFTINAAIEEWLHHYLTFTPLGFSYLLDITGISRDYEIATMNETVAGMVSDEIGAMVYARYYRGGEGTNQKGNEEFNREMRGIRLQVDEYLARGEIELAEGFMEERRLYLLSRGYYIRKLNQAYFAFHGTYADDPTSVSPIGVELRELREQSASVKDFLDSAAQMTSRKDLQESLEPAE